MTLASSNAAQILFWQIAWCLSFGMFWKKYLLATFMGLINIGKNKHKIAFVDWSGGLHWLSISKKLLDEGVACNWSRLYVRLL